MRFSFVLADVSVLSLGLRLVLSLAIVLGLIAALSWVARRGKGIGLGLGARKSAIEIRAREQLSRSTAVTLLEVGHRMLLIASNDQAIEILAEGVDLRPADVAVSTDDRTSSQTEPAGSVPTGMNMIEALREWSTRRV